MTPEESRQVRLAEFAALRSEITTFLTLQIQFMSYSITLGGAIVTLSIFLAGSSGAGQRFFEVVAFFPLPFLIFGLLYLDAGGRILRAAECIITKLEPTLIDPADGKPILEWESFIRKECKLSPLLDWSDKLRWALFLVPSLVPTIWWIWSKPQPQHRRLVGSLFVVEFILFFLFVGVAIYLECYGNRLGKKAK